MKDNFDKDTNRLQRFLTALKSHFDKKSPSMSAARREDLAKTLEGLRHDVENLESERTRLKNLGWRMSQTQIDTPSNVIPFRRPPRPSDGRKSDPRWMLRLDCLIESPHDSEIHKMALELHSHSHRIAFLDIRDLDANTRRSAEVLMGLGAITLFVPNILALGAEEQTALHRLALMETLHRPLLMVGTLQPYSELRGEPGANSELVGLLARAYIKLTRPFHEYRDQGLIHYFLDSLSSRHT